MLLTTRDISPYCIPGLTTKKVFDTTSRKMTIEEVCEIVCKYFDVTVSEIKLRSRKRELVMPRQLVGYVCTKMLFKNHSQQSVGNFFGQNHATVNHGNVAIENLMRTSRKFHYKCMVIFKELEL